ncbi:PREDICTED: G protein-regulated inducer of neurite outgrowth 3 [Thamnophis sirtalis]|uniref:G protein-regulated inducer of neurite outgrowth 3 n=1 Tax=Thamnophis sirtalis TaxID=35019 RepID=A0A6I9XYL0_9SAUR|nr:PREDICTED: G protein-regulated inducer of neurite outgrowth 3 [Thamnophis sirtalis]XP_013919297.1 PREDICTED: G protein-regulated inducer of neurite outgrowth 3 [Thamnophis sirtalis]
MGTVQDPLRSTKLSLVTAEESPKHLCKQASIESSSNGYPFTAKDQLSGGCLLEVNSGRETNVPKSDWHCEYDIKHPNILSPGSFSFSKEGSMAAPEPVSYAKQEGSRAKVQMSVPEAHPSEHGEVKVPLTQEANQNIPSSGGQSCNIIDKATVLPGGDLDITESKSKDYSIVPSLPIYSNIQQASPVGKDNMCEVIISETSPVLVSSDEMGLNPKAPVGVETELGNTNDANVCPKTEPQTASEFSNLETSCTGSEEPTAKVVPNLSKFKDTGTMTVKPENKSVEAETISRTHQDAGVQAVASVESRSASTSPSILTAFLRENMSPEAKQDQDQLHVIYTGARGKEQPEIIGDFAATVQTPSPIGIMHKVRVQIPPARENPLGSPNVRLQENLTNTHDPICAALLDKAARVCSSDDSQETLAKRTEVQTTGVAKNRGDVPQQLSDNSVLQKARPVSQISLSSSHPPVSTQHPANFETKLPPSFATPTIDSRYQPADPSSFREHPLPLCPRTSEQAKAIVIGMNTERTYQEKQLQIKAVDNLETALPSFPIAMHLKREGKVHLISEEQKINMTGSIIGSRTMSAPVVAESKQDTVPGDAKTETLAGKNPISKLSRSFGAAIGIQSDKIQKGLVLDVPAARTSSSPTPRLGEKKKGPKAFAAEAKMHLKQSKRVRDVVWDEQGMTWEVYGASLDPESLGIAIQNHLQRQIREHEKLIKAQSPQARKSISSDTSSNKKLKGRHHSVFQSMLQNFRRPNCCVRPGASSVLD